MLFDRSDFLIGLDLTGINGIFFFFLQKLEKVGVILLEGYLHSESCPSVV